MLAQPVVQQGPLCGKDLICAGRRDWHSKVNGHPPPQPAQVTPSPLLARKIPIALSMGVRARALLVKVISQSVTLLLPLGLRSALPILMLLLRAAP